MEKMFQSLTMFSFKKHIGMFAIEARSKGIARVYGKVVTNAGHEQLNKFMKETIEADAKINGLI